MGYTSMELIRNGATTGMESSGIYGENQKKWPVPSRKIVFRSPSENQFQQCSIFPGPGLFLWAMSSAVSP